MGMVVGAKEKELERQIAGEPRSQHDYHARSVGVRLRAVMVKF